MFKNFLAKHMLTQRCYFALHSLQLFGHLFKLNAGKMVRKRTLEFVKSESKPLEEEKENNENPPKRRSSRLARNTRSMVDVTVSPEITKKPLDYIKYNGQIKYYTLGPEIAETSDMLMQWVDKQTDAEVVPMAFDMEWPFSFQTGPGRSAVIQICVEENCCYIFHLTNLKKLPAALIALLTHPKVRLHGVNIKNDLRKLARDYPEVNADVLIEKCVDLGIWCNQVCETGGRWSLERLANFICKLAMDKSRKVRMSKWHVIPLEENQLMYASIDVYIGQVIYREIEKREKTKQKKEAEFLEKNGEDALKAIKELGETFL